MLAQIAAFLRDAIDVIRQSLTWILQNGLVATLAIVWWGTVAIARVLWACRAAALSVLLGGGLIVGTDQARDIVISAGLPSLRAWRVPVAVAVWALLAWYWARLTLSYDFITAWIRLETGWRRAWCAFWQAQVPRLLGTLAVLSVAAANWSAAGIYRAAGDTYGAREFNTAGWVYTGWALLFFLFVASRRHVVPRLVGFVTKSTSGTAKTLTPTAAPMTGLFDFHSPLVATFFVVTSVLAPLAALGVAADPVAMNDVFGGAVPGVLVGLALIVPIASLLVILSARYGLPIFAAVLLWIVMTPVWFGDIHDVRRCSDWDNSPNKPNNCNAAAIAKRPSLKQAFLAWWEANAANAPDLGNGIKAPPMVVVATAGGASRAAFWTAQVLSSIAEREPGFVDRVFMISGVSGGSLGAVAFRSLVEVDRLDQHKATGRKASSPTLADAAKRSDKLITGDFLGPPLLAGLYVDLPASGTSFLLPRSIRPDDRAAALEKSWEAAWKKQGLGTGKFEWRDGLNSVFNGDRAWPYLVLNGTSVEKGKRIVTSTIDFGTETNMSGPINRYDAFDIMKSDIPISTAVTMSARFPVVSPTGAMRGPDPVTSETAKVWGRVTDGGLFENFGALTADEVIRYLALRIKEVQTGIQQIVPMAILISSDPSLDPLHLRLPPNSSLPDCAALGDVRLPTLAKHPGNGRLECPVSANNHERLLTDPAIALYGGRVARGEAAATALADRIVDTNIPIRDRLVRKTGKSVDDVQARVGLDDHSDFFHFRQCRVSGEKTPTMSWHDSNGAFQAMRTMLGIGDNAVDHCGNFAEFFRLCLRLERVSGRADDDMAATQACRGRWGKEPVGWNCCDPEPGSRIKRPYCGINAIEYVTRRHTANRCKPT